MPYLHALRYLNLAPSRYEVPATAATVGGGAAAEAGEIAEVVRLVVSPVPKLAPRNVRRSSELGIGVPRAYSFNMHRTVVICFALIFAGCSPAKHADQARLDLQLFTSESMLMGCKSQITVWGNNEEEAFDAMRSAWESMNALELVLTDWNPHGEVAQLNKLGELNISPDLRDAFQTARQLVEVTGGAFDFEKGALYLAWREHRANGEVLDSEKARELASLPSATLDANGVLCLAPNNRLDFGGIGKGMAADVAGDILRSRGVRHFQVDCSGDLLLGAPIGSATEWNISTPIEGLIIRVPADHAVACSGDEHQFILSNNERLSHIIDPRTGQAIRNQELIFVVAPSATEADAWATALSVAPEKKPQPNITLIRTSQRRAP